jgi:hypothetical protein
MAAVMTLAFLCGLAMIASGVFNFGRWLSAVPIPLILIEVLTTDMDTVHSATGYPVWIILGFMAITTSWIMTRPDERVLRSTSGLMLAMMLLVMYEPSESGSTLVDYSTADNLIAIGIHLLIGGACGWTLVVFSDGVRGKSDLLISIGVLFTTVLFSDPAWIIFATTIGLATLLSWLEEKVDSRLGPGDGRSFALAVSVLIGVVLILVLSWVGLNEIPRIGVGALTVSLWLTMGVVVFGLFGMLTPLLGLDHRSRPEAWGWRTGLMLSPVFLILWTDLAPLLLPGIWLAIVFSLSAPLVLEKDLKKVA